MEIILFLIAGYLFIKFNGLDWLAKKTNRKSMRVLVEEYLFNAINSTNGISSFTGDLKAFAELSVLEAINHKPNFFNGSMKAYPIPKAGALYCLSLSANKLYYNNHPDFPDVMLACSIAYQHAEMDQAKQQIDNYLITESEHLLNPIMMHQTANNPFMREMDDLMNDRYN